MAGDAKTYPAIMIETIYYSDQRHGKDMNSRMLNIVLHEPEIPFNTGAIGRSCVASHSALHLIRPYGFELSDKYLKRAGMDYWPKLTLSEYDSYPDFLSQQPELQFCDNFSEAELNEREVLNMPKLWFATTKGQKIYSDAALGPNDYIMFGKESAGIPEEILVEKPRSCIRIPMYEDIRSLNLSNSVAILLYEALRQNDFMQLKRQGSLHRLHW